MSSFFSFQQVFDNFSPKMRKFAHISYLGEMIVGLLCYFIPMDTFDFMLGTPQIVGNILFLSGITNYITWAIRKKFCAKYGRLKPFILLCGIPAAIVMSIIPFLPIQHLPSVYKLVILHGAFTIMNFFYNILGSRKLFLSTLPLYVYITHFPVLHKKLSKTC